MPSSRTRDGAAEAHQALFAGAPDDELADRAVVVGGIE